MPILHRLIGPFIVCVTGLGFVSIDATAQAGELRTDRSKDPVVLIAREAPGIIGWQPTDLVAFKWDGNWQQIPVQVDERTKFPGVPAIVVYSDPETFVGSDTNPAIDGNDEVAFLALDLGQSAPSGTPAPDGTLDGLIPVSVFDPISKETGFAYLAQHDGSLDPNAGVRDIRYFVDIQGDAEDSDVRMGAYSMHFSGTWITDGLTIGGVDILDRHRFMFTPGYCDRTEDTFVVGARYIANRSGPVRAIRSVIGANSGTYTQRDMVMYRSRFEVRTYVRVHGIIGGMDLFDYSTDAYGMTYRNNLLPSGVKLDGKRDEVPTGHLRWEHVSGDKGAITIVHQRFGLPQVARSSYYLDTANPTGSTETQCTGDGLAIGLSGSTFGQLPDTGTQPGSRFTFTRIVYVDKQVTNPTKRARSLTAMANQPMIARQLLPT